MIRKQIPNIITLANLFSGCIAITMAFQGNFTAVVIWVTISAIFDFFDGMAARLLHAYSPLGKELDSLADVVSFGVAPAAAVFVLLRDHLTLPASLELLQPWIPYLAFLLPALSAYRLAKFNLDERQTVSFIGLPTPANGLFWISYCYAIVESVQTSTFITLLTPLTLLLIFVMSFLLISEIPMFSLKVSKLSFKGNERQLILIILTIALVSLFGIGGIAWAIIAYILLSLLGRSRTGDR